jgi:hypothetical protein
MLQKHSLYIIFIYTLCKAEILYIKFLKLYVRLPVYNSHSFLSNNYSLKMATLPSRNMWLPLQSLQKIVN